MRRPDEVKTLVDHLEGFIQAVIWRHVVSDTATVALVNKKRAALEEYVMELADIKTGDEPEEYKCPDCGSRMKPRTNKQSGNKFWGCIKYPNCRGTRDENGLSRDEREEQKYRKEQVAQEGGFSFNRDKRNPVTEVSPDTGWINPFAKK